MNNSLPGSTLDHLKIGIVLVTAISFIASIVLAVLSLFKVTEVSSSLSQSANQRLITHAKWFIDLSFVCRGIFVISLAALAAVAIYEDYGRRHSKSDKLV